MMRLIEDNIEKLKHQFECFQKGLSDRFLGQTIDKNPYEPRTYMADAWQSAWELVDYHLSQPIIYKTARYQYVPNTFDFGGGCISSYTCDKCKTQYICDTTKAKENIKEDGKVYIYGPCACGYICPQCYPNGRFPNLNM